MKEKKKPSPAPLSSLKSRYQAQAKTELEWFLIAVHFDSPEIRGADQPGREEVWNALLGVLTKWRNYVGCHTVDTPQLQLEAVYLSSNFPALTIKEIDWMIDLYAKHQLPILYPSFVQFSPAYMSEVAQGFIVVRGQASKRMADAVRMAESTPVVTPRERAETMRYMITEVARQMEQGAGVVWMLGDVYKFLIRTKRLAPGPDTAACKKWVTHELKTRSMKRTQTAQTMKELLQGGVPAQTEKMREELTRQYALKQYFEKHAPDKICRAITEKDFV